MGSRIYLHVHVSRLQSFAINFAVFGIVLTFFFHFEKSIVNHLNVCSIRDKLNKMQNIL